jgi:glycosyltransferase involved in cell wall biosynthesis
VSGSEANRQHGQRANVDTSGTELSDPPRVLAITAHRPHELREPLRLADAPSTTLELDPSVGFLRRNLAAVWRTRRAILDQRPDVVVFDCRELLGALVTLVCLLYGVPTVFRFKGNHWRGLAEAYRPDRGDGFTEWLRYRTSLVLDEFNYAAASGFVVVSEELKRVVVERTGCHPDQVQVVHVPLDTDRDPGSAERARERHRIDETRVFLTVTNLTYRKKYQGVETALRGMASVLGADDDSAYVVAGGGPYHEDLVKTLDSEIDDPDVRDRIYAPGFVEAVDDLYALADGFVYVSHLDGYPNAVLEAQQAGLPVVANAAFGMVEQVEDGETGYLLDDPGPADVAEAVSTLIADPERRARLGRNARESVEIENHPAAIGRHLVTALARIRQSDRQ